MKKGKRIRYNNLSVALECTMSYAGNKSEWGMIAIQVSFDSSSECTGLCHSISEAVDHRKDTLVPFADVMIVFARLNGREMYTSVVRVALFVCIPPAALGYSSEGTDLVAAAAQLIT
ncbi:hypothetical protein BLOT_007795 [Blomia tropicalis]|nr:hypothetical protein BLOT_007795 [Blomia tropicalis]